jgi:hypothetical protein
VPRVELNCDVTVQMKRGFFSAHILNSMKLSALLVITASLGTISADYADTTAARPFYEDTFQATKESFREFRRMTSSFT